jgi:DNA modification methylase
MENSIVLDGFGGSGSVLITCEQTNRISRMVEIDQRYCDVIVKRYIEYMGSGDGVSLERDGALTKYSELEK